MNIIRRFNCFYFNFSYIFFIYFFFHVPSALPYRPTCSGCIILQIVWVLGVRTLSWRSRLRWRCTFLRSPWMKQHCGRPRWGRPIGVRSGGAGDIICCFTSMLQKGTLFDDYFRHYFANSKCLNVEKRTAIIEG
jgi:hypothetical protein